MFNLYRTVESPHADKEWHRLQAAGVATRHALRALLDYVRSEYVEIDVEKTSAAARESYLETEKVYRKMFDDDAEPPAAAQQPVAPDEPSAPAVCK